MLVSYLLLGQRCFKVLTFFKPHTKISFVVLHHLYVTMYLYLTIILSMIGRSWFVSWIKMNASSWVCVTGSHNSSKLLARSVPLLHRGGSTPWCILLLWMHFLHGVTPPRASAPPTFFWMPPTWLRKCSNIFSITVHCRQNAPMISRFLFNFGWLIAGLIENTQSATRLLGKWRELWRKLNIVEAMTKMELQSKPP